MIRSARTTDLALTKRPRVTSVCGTRWAESLQKPVAVAVDCFEVAFKKVSTPVRGHFGDEGLELRVLGFRGFRFSV